MSISKKILGQRFGKLVVIERLPANSHHEAEWRCVCDCGNEHITTSYNLTHGKTTRCRECTIKLIAQKNTTHGQQPKKMFNAYVNMKTRCYNHNYYLFKNYGGKGITICDEWLGKNGFINFREWSLKNGYKDKLSIDRIDNNKGYSPDNCRWVTMTVQQNNRTNNRLITLGGETKTLADWCRFYKINYSAVISRLDLGWSDIDALTKPLQRRKERGYKL
jgi:hypothetical protein